MKRTDSFVVCLTLLTTIFNNVFAGGEIGIPKDDAEKTLRIDFSTPPPGYGEVPFWWWSGRDALNKERLMEQIDEIHKAGIAGVQVNYAHHRCDKRPTQDSEPKIFSDEWWDVFTFAAEECKKRGMGISLSNYTLDLPDGENLWNKLKISTPEMHATEIVYEKGKIIKRKVPRTYDPLNPKSGQLVVEKFFDPFIKKVPEKHRDALNFFFQDELLLSNNILWLWSEDLPQEFKKRKGYDIEPLLPALFTDFGPDTVKVRLDMNDVMSALACERYFKPIYDWHSSRGIIYGCDQEIRGKHPMYKYIDYMRTMKYFTAPGFDTPGQSADIVKNKVGSSIAHLYRRPRVWLEGYHSQGWQASTSTIFDSTCHNYLYGSNLLNLHGLYYSTYGGWWEWAPPCYHFRMPYWVHMKTFLKYFERLSYILSQGVHVCDVAVVNPLEPCVYDRNRGNISVGVSHNIVQSLVSTAQTDVDFIDADSLAKAVVKDGRLCVSGEEYRVIILPDMIAIRSSSLEKIAAFKKAGGKVFVLGDIPKYTDMPHKDKVKVDALIGEISSKNNVLPPMPNKKQLEIIASAAGIPDFRAPYPAKALHRRIGKYNVYFICDLRNKAECTFRSQGFPELWDPWDGTQKRLSHYTRNANGTTTVTIDGDGSPKLIVFSPDAIKELAASEAKPSSLPKPIKIEGEWDFELKPTLDNKWGDFRLPVRERFIGAEIRTVKIAEAKEYNLPSEMTVSYGPQFIDENSGKPFVFSWREGVEGKPAFQNWHHGLNGIVGNNFFILGPYSMWHYDTPRPQKAHNRQKYNPQYRYDFYRPHNAIPNIYHYSTYVYAPSDCKAKVVSHGIEPMSIELDGQKTNAGTEIFLSAGYHKLSVRFDDFGRAALVMMRTDIPSTPSNTPLSMCWYNDPAVLLFDPFGGKFKEGEYSATLPPACEEIKIRMRGLLLSATIEGEEAIITGQSNAENEKLYFVKPQRINKNVTKLVLKVKHEPGIIGGAVFTEPIRLKCGKGKITLGNWALIADGLKHYSGGGIYEKKITLTKEEAEKASVLDLGGVGASCGVSINDQAEKVLCCPPWRMDIKGCLKAGDNTLKISVYNTLNNHYQTIPTRYRTSINATPSGLLGPVVIR